MYIHTRNVDGVIKNEPTVLTVWSRFILFALRNQSLGAPMLNVLQAIALTITQLQSDALSVPFHVAK